MQIAAFFLLGVLIGSVTLAGVWYLEYRICRTKEIRQLQQLHEETEEQVLLMLDALPQGYIVIDWHLEILRAAKLAKSFGLIVEDALRPNLAQMAREVLETGQARDVEFDMVKVLKREPRARRIWVRIAKVNDARAVIFFEDQTEKRRLDETRRDFIANISHELKTPIGSIQLLSETITQVAQEPNLVQQFAEKLTTESARLTELVHEIIQLSRLQETDALADPEIVPLDAVVTEALARIEVAAKARQITLSRGGERGLSVYGDFALLVTAVRNLLDNAVRYSKTHSRVSVGISSENDVVEIAVVDAGQGIPQNMQARVFERFFRGDTARSRETGGSGLGLSIVKHIVQDHGGKVRLWSAEGRGSTFTIVLPKAEELPQPPSPRSEIAAPDSTTANQQTTDLGAIANGKNKQDQETKK